MIIYVIKFKRPPGYYEVSGMIYGENISTLMIVAFLLMTTHLLWIAYVQANWISSYSVRDLTDNRDLTPGEPQVSGHNYRITITIQVPETVPGSFFTTESLALQGGDGYL